jgi:glycosyltransferase involved in cell wall biosynthesis
MSGKFTAVIIPAYNEEARIVGTLKTLLDGAMPGEFEVTVVCNGCIDSTARLARAAFTEVKVIELSEASKTAAINAGLRSVNSSKIILLDADIRISPADCRLLLAALDKPGIEAAIGHMEINDQHCSRPVKAFYRVWEKHPYLSNGKFAAAFAISKKAIDRIGELPQVIADDTFISRKIAVNRIAVVDGVRFTADVPRELPTLIRVRSRVHRGNLQLRKYALRPDASRTGGKFEFFRSTLGEPSLWAAMPVYLAVTVASRILALKQQTAWERDATTRRAVAE